MADKDIFQIEVDPSGAVTGYGAAAGAQDEFFKAAEQGSDDAASGFSELTQVIGVATLAIGTAAAATAGLVAAINKGSAVDDVASAFNNMATAAGATADVFLTKLNDATDQTISNFDIMRAANEAMRAGIKPDEFIELTEAARVLAEETGGNLTEELNQLSNAFETGRVMGLKNKMGVIDLEAANKAFADSIGVEVSELTKEQQLFIAREQLLDAAKRKQAEFGDVVADSGDAIAQIGVVFTNFTNDLSASIATNRELSQAVSEVAAALQNVDFGPIISGLSETISLALRAVKGLQDFSNWLDSSKATANAIGQSYKKVSDALATIGDAAKKAKTKDEIIQIQAALKVYLDGLKNAPAEFDGARVTGERLYRHLEDMARTMPEVAKETDEYIRIHSAAPGAINKTADAQNDLNDAIDEALGFDKFPALTKEIQDIMTGPWSLEYMAERLKDSAEGFIKAGGKADEFKDSLEGVIDNTKKTVDELNKIDQAAKDAADAFNRELGSAIGQGIVLAFSGDLEGGLRGIGGMLGADAGAALGGSIGGELGAAIGAELGEYIGEELGSAISDTIDHAFGGDHPDDEARKSVGEYFESLFEDLDVSLIINNKLVDSLDMILTHPVNGGEAYNWPEYLGLGPDQVSEFTSIGEAIRHALGFEDLPEGQLGALLATNFQDLNTLQQALQAIGMSAETLQKGLEDAFLNGEMSAKEFLAASAAVEDLYKRGIPGAIGATDQAMKNFINGAMTSGRAAWDGLGDIASEAMERGVGSMQELEQLLLSQGFAVDDLTKFFDVLKRHGIDSLEELANVSVEQAAIITSELEDAGFAFAPALDHVDEIRDAIEDIPDQNVGLTVKVRTVAMDSGAQAIMDSGAIKDIKSNYNTGEGRA